MKSLSTKGERGDENKRKRQSGKGGKGENRVERWKDFTKSREQFASAFLWMYLQQLLKFEKAWNDEYIIYNICTIHYILCKYTIYTITWINTMIYLGNMQNDKIDSILISKVAKAEADEREAAAAKIQVLLNRFQFLSKKILFPKQKCQLFIKWGKKSKKYLKQRQMQAGFKGHQTRKDLKSKANEKEDNSKRDHEGSVKIESWFDI